MCVLSHLTVIHLAHCFTSKGKKSCTFQKLNCFFFRVRHPWRATWRALQACWRLTFQTTKTKSCVFYVLCKFTPVLPPFLMKWSVFAWKFFTEPASFLQRPPPTWEADCVYNLSRPSECKELQLWGRVCGGHDQATQGDTEEQLVQWSCLLGKLTFY